MRFRVTRWGTSHLLVTGARLGSGRVGSSGITSQRHSRCLRAGTTALKPFVCSGRRRAGPDQRTGRGGHLPRLADVPTEHLALQRHRGSASQRRQFPHAHGEVGVPNGWAGCHLGVDRGHDGLCRVVGRLRVCHRHRDGRADLEEPQPRYHDRPWVQPFQHRDHFLGRRLERRGLRGRRRLLLVRPRCLHRRHPLGRLHGKQPPGWCPLQLVEPAHLQRLRLHRHRQQLRQPSGPGAADAGESDHPTGGQRLRLCAQRPDRWWGVDDAHPRHLH